MHDISPVLFRGERDGELRTKASWLHPMFFAETFDQAKLYAGRSEPYACILVGRRVLDLTQPDPRNPEHKAFVAALTSKFDDWTCRYSGEARDAWSFIETGDLYDYEGTGDGDRWNTMFRLAMDEFGYDAVRAMDCTDGTDKQPSAVWVIQDTAHLRKTTVGEELLARVRSRPWAETERWIEKNCAGVLERLSRLSVIDEDYRLDKLHVTWPPAMLKKLGDRESPRAVYRGLPSEFDIRPGDWVALDRGYAGQHQRDGGSTKSLEHVLSEDIHWSGTDENEFFYLPAAWRRPGLSPEQHLAALSDDQVRMFADGEMSRLTRFAPQADGLRERIMAEFDPEACGVYHGPEHWARVQLHAMAAARAEGIDPLVPALFGLVHDSQREDEGQDPEHGPRAAEFIRENRDTLFSFLRDAEVDDLALACDLHSDGETEGNACVRSCWDGDRLDLGRVDIEPNPRYLCTDYGKREDVIHHAGEINGFNECQKEMQRQSEAYGYR